MKIDVTVPTIGESITEVTMGGRLVENGAHVEEDDVICEIESEKATVEVTAEKSGIITFTAEEGDTVEIGAVIAQIETDGEAPVAAGREEKSSEEKSAAAPPPVEQEEGPKVSPVAANILRDAGIDPASVKGTGVGGRVTKADALNARQGAAPAAPAPAEKKDISGEAPAPASAAFSRNEKRVRMTTLRKTIARRLLEAKHGTAMLTTFNEVDLSKVKEVRAAYKETFKEKHGVGLGFMSFFTKACTLALKEVPGVNAMIDGDQVIYHDYADIGIAVSTEKGLVVPVIRNAESLSLAQIEAEVLRLALRARDGKLTIDEMTGGTFTITNGGVFGSMMSTPIINAPQSAILGMHAINDRPVVVNGEIVIRPMMYLAMSYDHRIVDGKESVTFLKMVKELLEDPVRMLLDI